MSGEPPRKGRLTKKRLRLLLVLLLAVSLVVLGLFGAPFAAPFNVSKVAFASNVFIPITPNGGFELNDNSWSISSTGPGFAKIVTGGAASGNRSLYISDPGQSVSVGYNDSTAQVLPLLINASTTFGFDLKYVGPAVNEGQSYVTLILILSWRLNPNDTFPLTLVLGNFSSYLGSTYDSVNASAGILMLRGVRSVDSWNTYELQLGTPRVDSLIKGYLLDNSSTLYNVGDPIYVMGFGIAVANADAYFDNLALYNVIPSKAEVTLSKPTLLPSTILGFIASVDGVEQNSTVSYGLTTDTVTVTMDLPLAYNATYQFEIQTGWGTALYSVTLTDPSLPSWI